jgi:hypothetical protein
LKEKVAAPVKKIVITAARDTLRLPHDAPLTAKDGTNFADKRRSLADQSNVVIISTEVKIIIINFNC